MGWSFGNRKGNSSAKRITTELVDDWYYMAERAAPTWGKAEIRKSENPAHDDVQYWYYLNFDFQYKEEGVDKPYTMHIDIKEKADGAYFYSFGVDKTKELRPSGLLSEVTTDGGNEILSNNHYAQPPENVNSNAKFSLPSDTDSQYMAVVKSGAAFFLSCPQADGTLYSECFAKKKPPFRYFRTVVSGAGDGNRTHVASLEGWSSTIELHPRLALCYYSNAGCGLSTARCAI